MTLIAVGCEPRKPSVNLIEAVSRKHFELEEVEVFLEANPNSIAETDGRGQSPLQIASMHGRTRAVALLLEHGANVNQTDANGRTALHFACHEGEVESARRLPDVKARVNVADSDGDMPLHCVVEWSPEAIDLIRLLLDSGADVNAKTNDGESPLDIAVRQKNVYMEPSKDRKRSFDRTMIEQYEAVEQLLKDEMDAGGT